jgi:16S rRNA (uracil1498-N3)-methyltransferase
MHSFYLPEKVTCKTASISDKGQVHHLRDVLRLKAGDEVVVFDSGGDEYSCTIIEIGKKRALLHIGARKPAQVRKLKLAIACGVPKQSRMDDIIDKLTQLGVDYIMPLVTERVVVRPAGSEESRLDRWRTIARSASEQSHRNRLPFISPPKGLGEVLAESKDYQFKLVPTLAGERKPLNKILAGSTPVSVFVLIGPEGDFTPREVRQALDAGFDSVSLGDTVLRVETAAVAVASYIELAFG